MRSDEQESAGVAKRRHQKARGTIQQIPHAGKPADTDCLNACVHVRVSGTAGQKERASTPK